MSAIESGSVAVESSFQSVSRLAKVDMLDGRAAVARPPPRKSLHLR
jgi:hypothetical protein